MSVADVRDHFFCTIINSCLLFPTGAETTYNYHNLSQYSLLSMNIKEIPVVRLCASGSQGSQQRMRDIHSVQLSEIGYG